jgi:hypothetical protein
MLSNKAVTRTMTSCTSVQTVPFAVQLKGVVLRQVRRPGIYEELCQPSATADEILDHLVPLPGPPGKAGAADAFAPLRPLYGRLQNLLQLRFQNCGATALQQAVPWQVFFEVRQKCHLQRCWFPTTRNSTTYHK